MAEEYELPSFADLRLLVSELVTNSVVHAATGTDDWVELRFDADDQALRVEVCDESADWQPRRRTAGLDEPGGWGLFIVEQLSDRWGISQNGETCVWFELAAEDALSQRALCRNGASEGATHLVRTASGTPATCDVCGELVTYNDGFARRGRAVLHWGCLG
jgi:anti-sigma regulatory factor (Ser/Thr protein kinase)